jgi:hypothetical protein
MNQVIFTFLIALLFLITACKKDEEFVTNSKLIIKLAVDSTQVRLGNDGYESTLPYLGNKRGQHPKFNTISANYKRYTTFRRKSC